jgi:hypothetical protein
LIESSYSGETLMTLNEERLNNITQVLEGYITETAAEMAEAK